MTIDDLLLPPMYGVDLAAAFDAIYDVDQEELRLRLSKLKTYKEFLATTYWNAVAHTIKERDGRRCRVCNREKRLDAHHRRYCERGTEHLNLNDISTLCRKCHDLFHEYNKVNSSGGHRIKGKKPRKAIRRMPEPKPLPPLNILGNTVVLTKELIAACRRKGAFTKATIDALGVTDLSRKWTRRLIGQEITKAQYEAALEGRFHKQGKQNIDRIQRNGNFVEAEGRLIYSPVD